MLSKNFAGRFELVRFPPVHLIKPEEVLKLQDELQSCGLLLAQRITEDFRGGIGLGTNTLNDLCPPASSVLTWPNVYWTGYNPELFYLKNKHNRASFTDGFDYHHRAIFAGYLEGKSVNEVIQDLLSDDRFAADVNSAESSLKDLREKELELDLKAVPCILENYRDRRLFWTFNHPSQFVILDLARQVLHALGLTDDLPAAPPREVLNTTIYPIMPGTHTALGLKFNRDDLFKIRNKTMQTLDVVREYYNLYERIPEIVEHNRAEALPVVI